MNILVINQYGGSGELGMEYRPFYLGREWVSSGHSVTVVAASFSHVRNVQPRLAHNLDVTEEEGVRYRWVKTNVYEGNGAARLTNIFGFVAVLSAFSSRIAREERPDVVVCSSTHPLDIYPGERIAQRAGAHLVFEVHDLWPLAPMLLGGYSAKHPFIRVVQWAEDKAYRDADLVVSILPAARDYMVSRGMHPGKFVHIPNGVVVQSQKIASDDRLKEVLSRIETEKKEGRFCVCYAGNIGVAQGLSTLVDAAGLIKDRDVAFFFLGGGSEANLLKTRALAAGIRHMHFLGRVAKAHVSAVLESMDLLYFGLRGQPLFQFGISPNKLFDYMLAGRPILQAVAAGNDLVREADCGSTVPPDNPRAIADALLMLRDKSPEERGRLGENGRRFVIQKHDYRILAQDFMRKLEELTTAAAPFHAQVAV